MKILYFDCVAGASGDMILAALLAAGLDEAALRGRLAGLHLPGFDLQVERVQKSGIAATHVEVLVDDDVPERRLRDLVAVVEAADLPPHVIQKSVAILRRIGEVEAGIHGARDAEHVHLHELGGLDTLVDVVGGVSGIDLLGVEKVICSPIPLGRGFTRSAHGRIPVPAPATLALLQGAPVTGSDVEGETVTPTGAALLTSLASGYGPIPAMTLRLAGYGAGRKEWAIPNVLRVLIGDDGSQGSRAESLSVLETNIDDLNPETYDYVMARLFAAGALDVFLAPIQMKKNRPATLLSVLCRPALVDALSAILFAETSTLGIRRHDVLRTCLPREIRTVETPYGPIRVKVATYGDREKAAPEYEDCRRAAEAHGVPLREVYAAVRTAPP
jgi:pyridinium-3,5-bisthiocarboxylic acid mononucleotide nickel chelatase